MVESQYDANRIQHAANVLKEFLSERGRQYATVDPQIEQIPPSSLALTFNVNEGPKVKVGTITITGNQAYSQRWVIDAMKNLHPYGIPHSIFFENLFAKTYDAAKLEEDGERIRQAYSDHGYFKAKVARADGEHCSARRQGLAAAHYQDGSSRASTPISCSRWTKGACITCIR